MSISADALAVNGLSVGSNAGANNNFFSSSSTQVIDGQTVYSGTYWASSPFGYGTISVTDFNAGNITFSGPGFSYDYHILGTSPDGNAVVFANPGSDQPTWVLFFTYPNETAGPYDSRNPAPTHGLPCFGEGTSITTPQGERAVEDLAIGDLVILATGGTSRIVWTGSAGVDCSTHPEPREVLPIVIDADAFAPSVPNRQLRVSPGHGIAVTCVDELLVPAGRLVLGSTIRRETVPYINYYHIELERHGLVLANGLPAESYLDVGNRRVLRSGDNVVAINAPFFEQSGDGGCRPQTKSSAVCAALRERLSARAHELGWRLEAGSPQIRLSVDDVVVPSFISSERAVFIVPETVRSARLMSNTYAPRFIDPISEDDRALGIMLTSMSLQAADRRSADIDISANVFLRGCYPFEPSLSPQHRWTNGDAWLSPSIWPEDGGNMLLEIRFAAASNVTWQSVDLTAEVCRRHHGG